MPNVKDYDPSKDPRLIDCKTECGNGKCLARRYGLFASKTCPNFEELKPTTNADRIRAMSDEELAVLLEGCICPTEPCKKVVNREKQPDKKMCQSCWLDWLRQEVEDA